MGFEYVNRMGDRYFLLEGNLFNPAPFEHIHTCLDAVCSVEELRSA